MDGFDVKEGILNSKLNDIVVKDEFKSAEERKHVPKIIDQEGAL